MLEEKRNATALPLSIHLARMHGAVLGGSSHAGYAASRMRWPRGRIALKGLRGDQPRKGVSGMRAKDDRASPRRIAGLSLDRHESPFWLRELYEPVSQAYSLSFADRREPSGQKRRGLSPWTQGGECQARASFGFTKVQPSVAQYLAAGRCRRRRSRPVTGVSCCIIASSQDPPTSGASDGR